MMRKFFILILLLPLSCAPMYSASMIDCLRINKSTSVICETGIINNYSQSSISSGSTNVKVVQGFPKIDILVYISEKPRHIEFIEFISGTNRIKFRISVPISIKIIKQIKINLPEQEVTFKDIHVK